MTSESEAACPSAQWLPSLIGLGHCAQCSRLKWSFKNLYYPSQGAVQLALVSSWLLCGSDANAQVGQPSFQQALKKLHTEKQETAVCHSLTEREIVSSSLDTRMLKAGPEQNGPWLETNQPPSHLEAFIQCQLNWGSTWGGCEPMACQEAFFQRPQHNSQALWAQSLNGEPIRKQVSPKRELICSLWSDFPSSTLVPILIGAELFKEGVSWKTWNPGATKYGASSERLLWCPI